jgi:hypothetical protein
MKQETLKIKMTFTEPLLGSQPGNKEVHSEFIAARAAAFKGEPPKTAVDAVEETEAIAPDVAVEKASTVFARDEKGLLLWDYQFRGFLKEAINTLIDLGECKLSRWSYKRSVDQFVFVTPRRVYLRDAEGKHLTGQMEFLERPLRATTMQGDRIALARSEMLQVGTNCELEFKCMLPDSAPKKTIAIIDRELVKACLDYNADRGWGQWRSGGYGRYTWEEVK